MFSIDTVTLSNFKSYKGSHDLQFPVEPGLYFLTGRNDLEPKLGSNGAGKSTLLDAIYWCLFGHTTRGLKASEIVSWGEATCMVAVKLTVGQDKITIIRKQAPNSLTLDGRPVVQEAVDKALGLNAESFKYSVILPQFNTPFFDRTPTEKLALFSDIMGLDFWLEKSEQAADRAIALADELTKLDNSIRGNNAHLTSIENDIHEFTDKKATFETMREKTITELKGRFDWVNTELEQLTDERHKTVNSLKKCIKEREVQASSVTSLSTARDRNIGYLNELKAEHVKVSIAIRSIEAIIDKLLGMKVVCPHCQQKVDAMHLQRERQRQGAALSKERINLSNVNTDIKEANKIIATLDHKLAALSRAISDTDSKTTELKMKVSHIDAKLGSADQRGQELMLEIRAKKAEENPFVKMLKERNTRLTYTKDILLKQTKALANRKAEYTSTHFWVAGFKRVRLFIIEETLRQLEIEVNNSLASLGLVDWHIELDVERENKSGGVTKGFVVFIRCPSHPEPVRWEAWSGGETQRLQLAGDFGLANLIMMQAGLTNTIEFYDEPSNHLSDEGLNDLAETLHQRAIDEGKTIWLVDHRMPEFGEFAATLLVVKTEAGSSFE